MGNGHWTHITAFHTRNYERQRLMPIPFLVEGTKIPNLIDQSRINFYSVTSILS